MTECPRIVLDVEKTCRTCLTQKTSTELHLIIEKNLVQILELTNVKLSLNLCLPKNICTDCIKHLTMARHFRKQIIDIESQLGNFIFEERSEDKTFPETSEISDENLQQIIEPQTNFKEDVLIIEDVVDETMKNVEDILNDSNNIYTITSSLKYLDNYRVKEVVTGTVTNVIKWAEAQDTSLPLNNHNACSNEKNLKNNCLLNNNGLKPGKIANYICDLCSKTFRFEFIFKKHLLKHGSHLECEVCLLTFEDSNSYLVHVKEQHPQYKPFSCPNCEQRFHTLTPLKMHFNQHLNNNFNKFECDICGKKYSQQKYLTVHKTNHNVIRSYKCDICQKKLADAHSLRNHLKIHKGDKKHKCDTCGAKFIHRFSLKSHLRTHTGEKPFACKFCDNKFSTSSYLKIHLRTHTDEKPYKCLQCAKSFVSRCALAAHEKAHSGEKKFQCDVCGWRSSRSADLQTHIRKHTGEKPYNCEKCSKSYKTASNLAAHRRTHLGLKQHICSICLKAFGDPRTLKSHIRIHTGETPYMCHICGHRLNVTVLRNGL
ncbi:hypothetical protein ABEB36_005601 [Hypothenemus hampei]|uniref:Uncharacterized protein n=2 Tax=Hypothenemus hampei TaxID=57062 RepID=A0ABD1EYT1_HYPHA